MVEIVLQVGHYRTNVGKNQAKYRGQAAEGTRFGLRVDKLVLTVTRVETSSCPALDRQWGLKHGIHSTPYLLSFSRSVEREIPRMRAAFERLFPSS